MAMNTEEVNVWKDTIVAYFEGIVLAFDYSSYLVIIVRLLYHIY
jgi:hypothetical protein